MPYEVSAPSVREHLSFSQLELAANCGEAYRRRYVEGERGLDAMNVPALVGSAFHLSTQEFEVANDLQDDGGQGFEWGKHANKALSTVTKDSVRYLIDEGGIDTDELIHYGKQDLGYFLREGIPKLSRNYLARRQYEVEELGFTWAFSPEESIEIECRLEIAGHPFVAYIDQVFTDSQGRTVIRDLKTGKPKKSHVMQLEQYRLALKRAYGVEADYGQALYVNGEQATIHTTKWRLSDGDVERMTARLVRAVGDGLFLVNGPFNGHCEVCDFRADCAWGKVDVHATAST